MFLSLTTSSSQSLFPLLIFLRIFLYEIDPIAASCMGCVELDEISFDKMIGRFDYTLVKFDIAFPYGQKHEIYGEFAKIYGPKIVNLLVSLVGVKDYGEKENRILAQRYQIDDKAYPSIVLFLNGDNQKYVKYPSDWEITIDNLKRFVKRHTNVYIPLDGCIEKFDRIAKNFAMKTNDQQLQLYEQIRGEFTDADEETKDKIEIYLRLMQKIIVKGDQLIIDERKRVEKLLKEKLSDKKKKQLIYTRNILQSFQTDLELQQEKDEL